MRDKKYLSVLQQDLYDVLSRTGFIDKCIFNEEIKKYTATISADLSPYEECLASLADAYEHAGGNVEMLCSDEYLETQTAKQLLETLGPNNIRFYYIKNFKLLTLDE